MTALRHSLRSLLARRSICLALVLSLAAAFVATAAQAKKELKTEDEKTLYLLGGAVARTLESFRLTEEELAIVLLGVEDSLLQHELLVDIPQSSDRVQAFHSKRVAEAAAAEKIESASYLERQAKLEGAVQTDSGLIITELSPGTGPSPEATDTVKVHYRGTLRDGTVFDSSIERGEPASFPLNRVIPCWTEGVARMKVGGKSRLVCPPSIAYGDRGAPPAIPGGAALSFEVELLAIGE